MEPKTAKYQKMAQPKKQQKTYRQQVIKKTDLVSKWGTLAAKTLSKSLKFTNTPKWTPGTSRDPKGIQKASKRHPKGIQKASKRRPKGFQIKQNLESEP